nr:MAG TPA: Gallinacin-2 PROTEIN [Caudoviricetes sp.]
MGHGALLFEGGRRRVRCRGGGYCRRGEGPAGWRPAGRPPADGRRGNLSHS